MNVDPLAGETSDLVIEDECWRIIELGRAAAGGDIEKQGEAIASRLSARTPADIIAFNQWTRTKMMEANRPDLLTAVEWVFAANELPEVSGDSWEYFRGWLVGRGRREYYAAIENPDMLADYFTTFEDFLSGEEIEYAANRGYELMTGSREVPDAMFEPCLIESWPGDEPEIERRREWLIARFPKLTARFGPPQFLNDSGGAAAS